MDATQLAQFEALCQTIYEPRSGVERARAEEALLPFSTRPDYLSQSKYVLDNSQSHYALLFIASAMTKMLTSNWNNFSAQMRVDIRNHILAHLASNGPKYNDFVLTALIQLVCRITKLGWFDDPAHQKIFDEVYKFLTYSSNYYYIGLRMFNLLVGEINDIQIGQHFTQHRKTANSFRDKALLKIFEVSLTSLRDLYSNNSGEVLQAKLKEQALELAFRCLSFDFIGTSPEESADDIGVVQIPSSWKHLFENDSTIKLFLSIYANSQPPMSSQAMRCLVQISSISRSAFNGQAERDQFLRYLMEGINDILQNRTGLTEQSNHLEFCRLLARLKANYQLSHIISAEGNYSEWMRQISVFTINTFSMWEWSTNSVYYLLTFWSRLVQSVSFTKEGAFTVLQTLIPQILKAYLDSRLESVQRIIQSSADDEDVDVMTEDEELLVEQLDVLPNLGRCNYDVTSAYIISLFDPLSQAYRKALESGGMMVTSKEFRIVQGQLSWLIQTIGGIIGGRSSSSESHEDLDADLAARVFEFLRIHDATLNQVPNTESKIRLETILIDFLEQFRKAYVGDQSRPTSKIYNRMTELLGIANEMTVISIIMNKIATVFKNWPEEETIISKALGLLHELSLGFGSSKRLVKLDVTNNFLLYHTSQFFPFLDKSPLQRRTRYYNSLAKLLFMEENISKFDTFMEPFRAKMVLLAEGLRGNLAGNTPEQLQATTVGLLRDLAGITVACTGRKSYCLFFDSLYPDYFPLFRQIAERFTETPEVLIPLLKFCGELAYNRGGRIIWDTSSVNGILLFREISAILVAYGQRALSTRFTPEGASNPYKMRYKAISLSLQIMTRALVGSYVNFGVFELYGDPALNDSLNVIVKLASSIGINDIMAYPKLQKSYFAFLEVLANHHASFIAKFDSAIITGMLVSLKEGLESLELTITTQSAMAIDRIVSYSLQNTTKPKELQLVNMMKLRMTENTELLASILEILLRKILFEESQNLWSMSRPVLSLMLFNPPYFNQLKANLIEIQPVEKRAQLQKHFDEILMNDVQLNLDHPNRERFSQNLNMFVQEVRNSITRYVTQL